MDFLCLLFFRFLHQTNAVSVPITLATKKNAEGNVAGVVSMTGVKFIAFLAPIDSPLGDTVAPDGSVKTGTFSSGTLRLSIALLSELPWKGSACAAELIIKHQSRDASAKTCSVFVAGSLNVRSCSSEGQCCDDPSMKNR
jgi:hypothetical protein